MIDIKQTSGLTANIMLKDTNGSDISVAYLNTTINGDSATIGININVTNKTLIATADATNVAGETVVQQYADFETTVKAKAKELGFTIFA